jgi:hypothetical protein
LSIIFFGCGLDALKAWIRLQAEIDGGDQVLNIGLQVGSLFKYQTVAINAMQTTVES